MYKTLGLNNPFANSFYILQQKYIIMIFSSCVKKKNYEKFEETMHALRGSDYQTQAELHDIQSVCNSTSTGGFISTIMNMKCKEVWIPVSMMLAMFILQVSFFYNFLQISFSKLA